MTVQKKPQPQIKSVPRNPKLVVGTTGVFTLEEIKRKVEYIWTSQEPEAINFICSSVDLTYTKIRDREKCLRKSDRNGVEDEVLGDFNNLLDSAQVERKAEKAVRK